MFSLMFFRCLFFIFIAIDIVSYISLLLYSYETAIFWCHIYTFVVYRCHIAAFAINNNFRTCVLARHMRHASVFVELMNMKHELSTTNTRLPPCFPPKISPNLNSNSFDIVNFIISHGNSYVFVFFLKKHGTIYKKYQKR